MKNDFFHNAITREKLTDLSSDMIEAGVDGFLSEGFAKDVPLVGSLLSIYKLCKNFSDHLLAKKIFKFLNELKSISENERNEFIAEIDASSKYSERVTDQLILHLEKFTDFDKASLLGRLFKFTIGRKIEYYEFLRLSYILNSVFISDLKYLIQFDRSSRNLPKYRPDDIMAINVYLPDFFTTLGLLSKTERPPKFVEDRASLSRKEILQTYSPQYSLTILGGKLILALKETYPKL